MHDGRPACAGRELLHSEMLGVGGPSAPPRPETKNLVPTGNQENRAQPKPKARTHQNKQEKPGTRNTRHEAEPTPKTNKTPRE